MSASQSLKVDKLHIAVVNYGNHAIAAENKSPSLYIQVWLKYQDEYHDKKYQKTSEYIIVF